MRLHEFEEGRDNLHDLSPQQKMIADVGRILDNMIPKQKFTAKTPDHELKLDMDLHALASRMSGYQGGSFENGEEVMNYINKSSNKTELSRYLQKALDAYNAGERADVSKTEPDPEPEDDDVEEGSIKYMHKRSKDGASHEEIGKELNMSPDEVRQAMSKTTESGLMADAGRKKHGEEYMRRAAQAGREGASQEELGRLKDKYSKSERKKK